jgi:hypothetical protein
MIFVTLQDVLDLARDGGALAVHENWSARAAQEDQRKLSWANAYIESELTRREIENACRRSQNALTGLSKSDVHPAIRDARVSYPLSWLLRGTMQHYGYLPSVEEFIAVLQRHPEYWAEPMWEEVKHTGINKALAWTGMRYRASVAWQAFMREQHALAGLRGLGIEVKSHPLVDVVFKIDGWFCNHAFLVYLRNEEFLFRKEQTPLTGMITHHLIAGRQPGNTGVWFVEDRVLDQCVDRIEESGGDDGQARTDALG